MCNLSQGIKEQAYVEGTENGIAIGKQEGITIGKQEGIAETIIKMYRKGYELVCIPSSRQLKKYKIFVLPGVYRATFLCRQSLLFMKFHWC